jgi:CheY-like chemotaxis protein
MWQFLKRLIGKDANSSIPLIPENPAASFAPYPVPSPEMESPSSAEATGGEAVFEDARLPIGARDGSFADISQELRTPLTLILAPLESMLMGEHGEVSNRQKQILQLVHNNSVKLLQMISGLLDLSKLEAGTIEVRRQPTNVLTLVAAMVEDFQVLAQRKNVRLLLDGASQLIVARLDRYLFERIVFNLLSNAIKFSPPDSVVTANLRWMSDRLIFTVSDTGPGIASDAQESIFKQFHKADDLATSQNEGIGLGLALVREFALLLGGSVTLKSSPGQGSTFAVNVSAPLVGNSKKDAAAITHSNMEAQHGTASGAPLLHRFEAVLPVEKPQGSVSVKSKVLICDSNVELGSYVAELLAQLCQTRVVSSGEEALNIVYSWKPDLVMTGIALPKKDGLTVCREIKARSDTAMIPVILLTSLTQRDTMLQGWDAGADEYVFKPFHPAELVTRVRSLLRSVQQRRKAQEQIERLNEALEIRVIELADANKELKLLAWPTNWSRQEIRPWKRRASNQFFLPT